MYIVYMLICMHMYIHVCVRILVHSVFAVQVPCVCVVGFGRQVEGVDLLSVCVCCSPAINNYNYSYSWYAKKNMKFHVHAHVGSHNVHVNICAYFLGLQVQRSTGECH